MKVEDRAYLIENGRIEEVELAAEVAGGFLVKTVDGDKIANRSSLYEIHEEDGWKCMQEYVMTLAHGGKNFYDGELINDNQFVSSCNDGFRPVSFLIKGTSEAES